MDHFPWEQESVKQAEQKRRPKYKTLSVSFSRGRIQYSRLNRRERKSHFQFVDLALHQAGVDQAGGEGEEGEVQEAGRREGGDQVRPQREGDILIGKK